MDADMSIINDQLDFSTVANVFLVHGSLQSPAFLDGRLCAELGLHDVSAEGWLEEVCLALNVEQPESREDPAVGERHHRSSPRRVPRFAHARAARARE